MLVAAAASGCLDDWELDEQLFPCRSHADCIDGFGCHPERYVCLPVGEIALDAGFSDAADPD